MLAAVGLAAVACAWFAGAHSRAKKQDALIDLLGGEETFAIDQPHFYYVERWGPKWLDLVGVGRFRRSIVGVVGGTSDQRRRGNGCGV